MHRKQRVTTKMQKKKQKRKKRRGQWRNEMPWGQANLKDQWDEEVLAGMQKGGGLTTGGGWGAAKRLAGGVPLVSFGRQNLVG